MSKVSGQFSTIVDIDGVTLGVSSTAATAAYADNDLVGSLMTVNVGKSGILQFLTLQDLSAQNAALEVLVFTSNPGSTTFTDNAAVDVADADLPRCKFQFSIGAGDYVSLADNSIGTVKNLALPYATADGNLYVALRSAAATPTYTASELSATFGLLVDLGL